MSHKNYPQGYPGQKNTGGQQPPGNYPAYTTQRQSDAYTTQRQPDAYTTQRQPPTYLTQPPPGAYPTQLYHQPLYNPQYPQHPQQYPNMNPQVPYAHPGYGQPPPPYPGTTPNPQQPMVHGQFDSGARFGAGATANIPPPPPGVMPTNSQMAAASGQPVVMQQHKAGWFEGAQGGGYTFW